MAQLTEVVQYLDQLLEPPRYTDSAYNGLQVGDAQPKGVSTVAAAVDAAESTILKAAERGAQLLIVHHGLLWGKETPLVGTFGRRVAALFTHGLSLYGAHLPLDGHLEVGNNVELARFFGATDIKPFFEHHGATIGCRATLTTPTSLNDIVLRAKELVRGTRSEQNGLPLLLPFGTQEIRTIGFVSGSGSSALTPAAEAGLDLLISGEAKHEVYHAAKELRMNALFCGHYRTETFGVQALLRRLEKAFGLSTVFIEDDSGI